MLHERGTSRAPAHHVQLMLAGGWGDERRTVPSCGPTLTHKHTHSTQTGGRRGQVQSVGGVPSSFRPHESRRYTCGEPMLVHRRSLRTTGRSAQQQYLKEELRPAGQAGGEEVDVNGVAPLGLLGLRGPQRDPPACEPPNGVRTSLVMSTACVWPDTDPPSTVQWSPRGANSNRQYRVGPEKPTTLLMEPTTCTTTTNDSTALAPAASTQARGGPTLSHPAPWL